jgi:hypothetical protein
VPKQASKLKRVKSTAIIIKRISILLKPNILPPRKE